MTELKHFHLQGGSLINYSFEVSPMDATFHPVAAVYVVTRQEETGNRDHQVLFVGEAERMPEHLRDHAKAACFARSTAPIASACTGSRKAPRGGRRSTT